MTSHQHQQQQIETQHIECRELQTENKALIAQCAKLTGQLETLQGQVQEQNALLAKAFPQQPVAVM